MGLSRGPAREGSLICLRLPFATRTTTCSTWRSSLHNVWMPEEYIQDAQKDGDEELERWFRRVQESDQKAGGQGKKMLMSRLG